MKHVTKISWEVLKGIEGNGNARFPSIESLIVEIFNDFELIQIEGEDKRWGRAESERLIQYIKDKLNINQ